MSPAARVLVTRPAREALRWVAALQARGIAAQALPLIEIGPAPDTDALAQARAHLQDCAAVMFVSANAVEGLLPTPGHWPAGPRAWATGPGTGEALERAGVPLQAIEVPTQRFDSEALWERVRGSVRAGDRVLVVRGADASGEPSGRDWLAQHLQAAGAEVAFVAAYRRMRPTWTAAEHAAMQAAPKAWWLFSSSEAIDNLGALAPHTDWPASRALCTHPRIAQAARARGFGTVVQTRPELEAVCAFLQSAP
ncbi:uroporphyrinogen-III synthase [Ramlibacter rhizophilus]|uniref:Uroporphyrinogen-III synthase n=1 Tax=Ramlibacter rhizophilus TaxID=1781167 RepID=A0A4Z0BDH9_9BURK|nr:uroporphyrinogen-III synthase [Ramlibacter rhizophilus]TFY96523.1 uroporphyrinogen-III synthase [Ramlibacter rhizophilus]